MSATNSSAKSSRTSRKTFFQVACFVSVAVYTAIVAADLLLPANLIWPALAAGAVCIVFAFLWAQTLDEVAMQAHYVGWYWGGSLGLGLAALIVVAMMPDLMQGVMPLDLPFLDQKTGAFLSGYMLGIMPPAIGYLVWWAIYWMRRR